MQQRKYPKKGHKKKKLVLKLFGDPITDEVMEIDNSRCDDMYLSTTDDEVGLSKTPIKSVTFKQPSNKTYNKKRKVEDFHSNQTNSSVDWVKTESDHSDSANDSELATKTESDHSDSANDSELATKTESDHSDSANDSELATKTESVHSDSANESDTPIKTESERNHSDVDCSVELGIIKTESEHSDCDTDHVLKFTRIGRVTTQM